MSLVECKHVTKKYGVKVALDDVNLTIEKGNHWFVRTKWKW